MREEPLAKCLRSVDYVGDVLSGLKWDAKTKYKLGSLKSQLRPDYSDTNFVESLKEMSP